MCRAKTPQSTCQSETGNGSPADHKSGGSMPKKIPMRQCAACREKKEKYALARVVRTPSGEVLYDAKGKVSGRGAYICKDLKCLEKAVKSRALARALECDIPDEAFAELRRQFEQQEMEATDGQ